MINAQPAGATPSNKAATPTTPAVGSSPDESSPTPSSSPQPTKPASKTPTGAIPGAAKTPSTPTPPPGVASLSHPPSHTKAVQGGTPAGAGVTPTPPSNSKTPQSSPTAPVSISPSPTAGISPQPAASSSPTPTPSAVSSASTSPTPNTPVSHVAADVVPTNAATKSPVTATPVKTISAEPTKKHGFMSKLFKKQKPAGAAGDSNSQGSKPSNPKKKSRSNLVVGLLLLVVLAIGGGASYFLMQQNQDLRQDASGTYCKGTKSCSGTETCWSDQGVCGIGGETCTCDEGPPPTPTPADCPNVGEFRCGECGRNECGTVPCPVRCQEPGDDDDRKCNGQDFDSSKGEYCCDNQQVCSAGQLCKPDEGKICVENEIPPDRNCGGREYDPNREYCCNGQQAKQYVCEKNQSCDPAAPSQELACTTTGPGTEGGIDAYCTRSFHNGPTAAFNCTATCVSSECIGKTLEARITTHHCDALQGNCSVVGAPTTSLGSITFDSVGQSATYSGSGSSSESCGTVQIDASWYMATVAKGFDDGHVHQFSNACGTGGGITTWNCVNNSCSAVEGAGGTYTSQASCQDACTPPPPPPPPTPTTKYWCNTSTYTCDSGTDVPGGVESYSEQAICENNCNEPVPPKQCGETCSAQDTCASGTSCVSGTCTPSSCIANGNSYPWGSCTAEPGSSCQYCDSASCKPVTNSEPQICYGECNADTPCGDGLSCVSGRCMSNACATAGPNGGPAPWKSCTAQPGGSCNYCDSATCTVKPVNEDPLSCAAECGEGIGTCGNGLACHEGRCAPPACQISGIQWDTCDPGTSSCQYCDSASCSMKQNTNYQCGYEGCTTDTECSGDLICHKEAGANSGTCLSIACRDEGAYTVSSNQCTPSGPGNSCSVCLLAADGSCSPDKQSEPLVGCAETCSDSSECSNGLVCYNGACTTTECSEAEAGLGTSCSASYGQSCQYCDQSTCELESDKGPYCGDGKLQANEECDDGNTTSGDGCSKSCDIEAKTITATPTPTPAPSAGCNDACVTNADCANSSYICYRDANRDGVCRLESNVTDANCAQAQPTLPQQLPATGASDILGYIRAGLAALGLGAVLLLML